MGIQNLVKSIDDFLSFLLTHHLFVLGMIKCSIIYFSFGRHLAFFFTMNLKLFGKKMFNLRSVWYKWHIRMEYKKVTSIPYSMHGSLCVCCGYFVDDVTTIHTYLRLRKVILCYLQWIDGCITHTANLPLYILVDIQQVMRKQLRPMFCSGIQTLRFLPDGWIYNKHSLCTAM